MKIIDNTNVVPFEQISCGDVFQSFGDLYMKTETATTNIGLKANAVRLENGIMYMFLDNVNVMPVECHLVIERK